jgi:hypothetical protein
MFERTIKLAEKQVQAVLCMARIGRLTYEAGSRFSTGHDVGSAERFVFQKNTVSALIRKGLAIRDPDGCVRLTALGHRIEESNVRPHRDSGYLEVDVSNWPSPLPQEALGEGHAPMLGPANCHDDEGAEHLSGVDTQAKPVAQVRLEDLPQLQQDIVVRLYYGAELAVASLIVGMGRWKLRYKGGERHHYVIVPESDVAELLGARLIEVVEWAFRGHLWRGASRCVLTAKGKDVYEESWT